MPGHLMSLERSSAVLCEKESRGLPRKAGALSGEVLSRRVSALFFLAAFSGRVGRAEKLFPCRAVCYLRSGDAGPKREGGPWSKFASRYGDSASRSRGAVPAGVLVASGIVESSPSRNGSLPRRRLAFSASECCILFEEGLLAKSALTYSNYFGVLRLFGR